jgi:hypothetical protein
MIDHLRTEHFNNNKHDEDELIRLADESHVHRNNQVRFWCGFCCKVIPYPRASSKIVGESRERLVGTEAWAWRFNHIDEHFKQERVVDDWIDDLEPVKKKDMFAKRKREKAEREARAVESANSRKTADGSRHNIPKENPGLSSSKAPRFSSASPATSLDSAIGSPCISAVPMPNKGQKRSRDSDDSEDIDEPKPQRVRSSDSTYIDPGQLSSNVESSKSYDLSKLLWTCVSGTIVDQ